MGREVTINRPESPIEAHKFTKRRNHYSKVGLCNRCAAQAAYAHAHGASKVRPPCVACTPLVQTFPSARPNGWRLITRDKENKNGPSLVRSDHQGGMTHFNRVRTHAGTPTVCEAVA